MPKVRWQFAQFERQRREISTSAAKNSTIVMMPEDQREDRGKMFNPRKTTMVERERALRGRAARMLVADRHAVHGTPMEGPFPGLEMALFGLGCFWGAEKGFWLLPGVHSTSVGYAGGYTPNASYEEVCSGQTGHTEVVRVVFDPKVGSFDAMLKQFWEGHDPTQVMRQGADVGTQYRSAIYYYSDEQRLAAER